MGSGGISRTFDMANRIESLRTSQRLTSEEIANLLKLYPKLDTPNVAYRNEGGLRFKDVSAEWGFDVPGISQGMALADLDNDGDLDVVMNNLNEEAGVFRNRGGAARLGVRLKGRGANTRAIGARIRVTGARVVQTQEMIGAGRYLSSDDPMRVFAAGDAGRIPWEVIVA